MAPNGQRIPRTGSNLTLRVQGNHFGRGQGLSSPPENPALGTVARRADAGDSAPGKTGLDPPGKVDLHQPHILEVADHSKTVDITTAPHTATAEMGLKRQSPIG